MEFKFNPSVIKESDLLEHSTQSISTNPIQSPTQTNRTVGLSFDNIAPTNQDNITFQNTVKLDIVPEKVIENNNENVTYYNPQIDTLKHGTFNQPLQKFAVQSIPIDEDRSMLPKPDIYDAIMNDVITHLNKQANEKPEFVTRKVSNWISRLIDQKGEDYITSGKLTVDEVSRNSERIIDDIIAGRIDYTKLGQYIIMPVFIETLINYCSNKLAINKAIQYSLGYVYNDYTNRYNINPNDTERIRELSFISDNLSRNITQAISIVNQDIAIYDIIYNRLKYVNSTKNASILFNIATELNYARKQLKKRY